MEFAKANGVPTMTELPPEQLDAVQQAAELLRGAQAVLVAAGAGIGVDSGLPDFRGDQGLERLPGARRSRTVVHAGGHGQSLPARSARRFYGHRLALYRRTQPHARFDILRRCSESAPH